MKRKIYPMPVAEVYLHPEFIALPPAGRGMLFTLLLHYWFSDCAPIPTSAGELYAVCRPSASVWATHKAVILRIFNDVRLGLAAYHKERTTRHAIMLDVGDRGRGIQRLKTLARKQATHGAREETVPQREANPRAKCATPEERGARARVAPGKSG